MARKQVAEVTGESRVSPEQARLEALGQWFDPNMKLDGSYRYCVGGVSKAEFEARNGTAMGAKRGRLFTGDPVHEGASVSSFAKWSGRGD
ncbi:MAG: hypothetical protein H6922_01930 [Pseudomonadaceae bacterium]|nr:hypothetical protein [Pseudomonadaceae bacterium]